MSERLKNRLPAVAATAVVAAVIGLVIVCRYRGQLQADTGETRRAVEAAVAEVRALRPSSLDEPSFRRAVEKLRQARHVGGVWLIRPDGQIAFSNLPFANRGEVEEWATEETRRILSEMPEGFLTSQQRVALLAASAIQSEGEHNDVLRQMIRPLRGNDNTELGFLGVSYEVNPMLGVFPGYGYGLALFLVPIGLMVYWLMLPCWVFLDAKARGERAWVWAMFVLMGNLAALFAYLLTRHPSPKPSSAS